MGERRVEHRLVLGERLGRAQVHQRRGPGLPQRAQHLLPLLHRSGVAADHHHHGFPVQFGRQVRGLRSLAVDDGRGQLVRYGGDPFAVEAQQPRRFGHRPDDRAGQHHRAERMEPELELGDDAEVPAAAAHAPEEVRVLVLARLDPAPVGGDQVHREQLVDGEPVLAHQPADPAAQGQPGDAGVRDDPGRDGQPERLRLAVQFAEQHPGLDPDGPGVRVHPDAPHEGEVDDGAVVAHRLAGEAVPAGADREGEPGSGGEAHGVDDVRDARAVRDEGGGTVYGSVPDPPVRVVLGVPGPHEPPPEGRAERCRGHGSSLTPGRTPRRAAGSGTSPRTGRRGAGANTAPAPLRLDRRCQSGSPRSGGAATRTGAGAGRWTAGAGAWERGPCRPGSRVRRD